MRKFFLLLSLAMVALLSACQKESGKDVVAPDKSKVSQAAPGKSARFTGENYYSRIYAVTGDNLYGYYPPAGSYAARDFGTGWSGAFPIVGLNAGNIAYVQNGRLYKYNIENGAFGQLGTGEYYGTTAMAYDPVYNSIYAVQGPYLLRISPTTGVWTILGTGDWTGTSCLTVVGQEIYAIQGRYLVKADMYGKWWVLGSGDWTGTKGLIFVPGQSQTNYPSVLYAVQEPFLLRVNPTNGTWGRIGTKNWTGVTGMVRLNDYIFIEQSTLVSYAYDTSNHSIPTGGFNIYAHSGNITRMVY